MTGEIQLPDGVERYSLSIRNRLPALSKQPLGKVVLVSDLPAIIAQEREKLREELTRKSFVEETIDEGKAFIADLETLFDALDSDSGAING